MGVTMTTSLTSSRESRRLSHTHSRPHGPYDGVPLDEQVIALYCGSLLLPVLNQDVQLVFENNASTHESRCYIVHPDFVIEPIVFAKALYNADSIAEWMQRAFSVSDYQFLPTSPRHRGVTLVEFHVEDSSCMAAITIGKRWVLVTALYTSETPSSQRKRELGDMLIQVHCGTYVVRGETPFPHGHRLPLTDSVDDLVKRADSNMPTVNIPEKMRVLHG